MHFLHALYIYKGSNYVQWSYSSITMYLVVLPFYLLFTSLSHLGECLGESHYEQQNHRRTSYDYEVNAVPFLGRSSRHEQHVASLTDLSQSSVSFDEQSRQHSLRDEDIERAERASIGGVGRPDARSAETLQTQGCSPAVCQEIVHAIDGCNPNYVLSGEVRYSSYICYVVLFLLYFNQIVFRSGKLGERNILSAGFFILISMVIIASVSIFRTNVWVQTDHEVVPLLTRLLLT